MRVTQRALAITLAVALIIAIPAIAIAGSYALGLHALNSSQHKWCTTLELLTAEQVPKPADPKANPSRENAYLFFSHLRQLEKDFSCLRGIHGAR